MSRTGSYLRRSFPYPEGALVHVGDHSLVGPGATDDVPMLLNSTTLDRQSGLLLELSHSAKDV